MRAEEVHREKLKQLGYKDVAIEELVSKYIANCTYDFAEAYHTELLNIDSVRLSFDKLDTLDVWLENGLIPELKNLCEQQGYNPNTLDVFNDAKKIVEQLRGNAP